MATLSRCGAPGVRPPCVKVPPAPKNRRSPSGLQPLPSVAPTSSWGETGLGEEMGKAEQLTRPPTRPLEPGHSGRWTAPALQPPGARLPQQMCPEAPPCLLLEASAEGPGPPHFLESKGRVAPRPEAQPARTSGHLSPATQPHREASGARRPLPRRRASVPTEGAGSSPCARGSGTPWASAHRSRPTPRKYQ